MIVPHDRRTLVERLDFVTTVGHGDGRDADGAPSGFDREALGLRGRGPTAVITDLAVLRARSDDEGADADAAAPRRDRRAGAGGDRLAAARRRRSSG